MLTHLRIRSLAIIDTLEVSFGPGLTVLTGETGAGKSILVTALQLVLGARGRPELVRTGAERAEVEALFDVSGDPAAMARLRAMDIDTEGELVVRRVLEAEGRSRATINGRLATNAQLERVAAGLVDISSQHEHHSLVDASSHLGYLDAYAGLDADRATLAEAWARHHAAEADRAALMRRGEEDRAAFLRFQLDELERAGVGADDEAEAARLQHATLLADTIGRAEDRLYGGDQPITASLARIGQDLASAARVDPAVQPFIQRIHDARAELEDVGQGLGTYVRGIHADPARLAVLEERIHESRRLRRKHGDDLPAAADRLRADLDELEHLAERLATAGERATATRDEVAALATRLSEQRRTASAGLSAAITRELASLGMGEARVDVLVDDAGLGATGIDRVEFLIATNRGEEPRPLRRVASGGELSRALLAVKRVLAALGPVGLYVFDEVDTGVGGPVAGVIGRKLAEVAAHHQVLCITHLAPIAAYGTTHFHVHKHVAEDRTRSAIVRLGESERVEEIARMLGGDRITETTRAAARELLAG